MLSLHSGPGLPATAGFDLMKERAGRGGEREKGMGTYLKPAEEAVAPSDLASGAYPRAMAGCAG